MSIYKEFYKEMKEAFKYILDSFLEKDEKWVD